MLYSKENLKNSYINNKRMIAKINAALFPVLKIELKKYEDYKCDAFLYINNKKTKLEIKQRLTKNLTKSKLYNNIYIHKSSIDHTDAEFYMVYGSEYNTIMIFATKDVDKSKYKTIRTKKGEMIDMYEIELSKCQIINIEEILKNKTVKQIVEYVKTLDIDDTEDIMKVIAKINKMRQEELALTLVEYMKKGSY